MNEPRSRLADALAADLGTAAREYLRREHDLARVADAYTRALEQAAGGEGVGDAVLWRIAEAAAGLVLERRDSLEHARPEGVIEAAARRVIAPALVDRQHPLAKVDGAFNAVMLQGDAIREITLE